MALPVYEGGEGRGGLGSGCLVPAGCHGMDEVLKTEAMGIRLSAAGSGWRCNLSGGVWGPAASPWVARRQRGKTVSCCLVCILEAAIFWIERQGAELSCDDSAVLRGRHVLVQVPTLNMCSNLGMRLPEGWLHRQLRTAAAMRARWQTRWQQGDTGRRGCAAGVCKLWACSGSLLAAADSAVEWYVTSLGVERREVRRCMDGRVRQGVAVGP